MPDQSDPELTPRQLAVLRAVVECHGSYACASRSLDIQVSTVRRHMADVARRLGVSGILAIVEKVGWLDVPAA